MPPRAPTAARRAEEPPGRRHTAWRPRQTVPSDSGPRRSSRIVQRAECLVKTRAPSPPQRGTRPAGVSTRSGSTRRSGRTILIGMPGNPAPDPTSARDSSVLQAVPEEQQAIEEEVLHDPLGVAEPTRRWTRCHFTSSARYLPKAASSCCHRAGVRGSALPADASRSSAALTASRRLPGWRRQARPASPREPRAPWADPCATAGGSAARWTRSSRGRGPTAG